MGSLWIYVVRRLLFMVPVFLAVSVLTFVVTNAAGNPIDVIRFGIRNLSPSQLAFLQDYYHVNQPLYAQ